MCLKDLLIKEIYKNYFYRMEANRLRLMLFECEKGGVDCSSCDEEDDDVG
jgi:hypothetical protein